MLYVVCTSFIINWLGPSSADTVWVGLRLSGTRGLKVGRTCRWNLSTASARAVSVPEVFMQVSSWPCKRDAMELWATSALYLSSSSLTNACWLSATTFSFSATAWWSWHDVECNKLFICSTSSFNCWVAAFTSDATSTSRNARSLWSSSRCCTKDAMAISGRKISTWMPPKMWIEREKKRRDQRSLLDSSPGQ